MKNILTYCAYEIKNRLFSSKKKIIKFLAICLVPFLYGFICIWAFWNPVPKIGEVPMAIVDNSKRIDLAVGFNNENGTNKVVIGQVAELNNGVPVSIINPVDSTKPIQLSSCLSYKQNYSFIEAFIYGWHDSILPDPLIKQNANGTYTINISDVSPLKNVSYFNDKTKIKANDIATYNPNLTNPITGEQGAWDVTNEDYWMQIQIPTEFNYVFSNLLTNLYVNNTTNNSNSSLQLIIESLQPLKEEPINIWTTFKKNFLFGQFMKVFQEFKSSLYIDFFPQLLLQLMMNIITESIQDVTSSFHKSITFTPTNDMNITLNNVAYHIGSKGEANSIFNGSINLKAGNEYIFRNDEIVQAISNAISADENISEVDKNKLINTASYEGNTTTLNDSNNDWIISKNTSFVDLTVLLTKPVLEGLSNTGTSSKNINSQDYAIPTTFLKDYLTNKMFWTSLYEKDKNVLPTKPIHSIFDNLIGNLIENIPSSDNSILFSNNTNNIGINNIPLSNEIAVATGEEWSIYIKKYEYNIFYLITEILNANKNYYANAPPSLTGIITSGVIGEQFSEYGVGLGQFFLFIGIWVGILMQTFMLDRKRRGPSKFANNFYKDKKKVTRFNRLKESLSWYYSKTLVMLFLSFIQVTILTLTIACLGWYRIGPPFGLVYLQLLFSAVVFTLFIQSLWFLFRDDVIGKFIVILFLIINLSSGWGTFPPMMQFGFFRVISYIAPFTYQIKNLGAIIYGIAIVGSNSLDNLFILQNIGISLIFVIIAICLSIIGSLKLTKMQFYGSFNQIKLAKVMQILQQFLIDNPQYDYHLNFDKVVVRKKSIWAKLHLAKLLNKSDEIIGINWDELPQEYDQFLCDNVNKFYPYEQKFNWFIKKYENWQELEMEDAKI